MYKKVGWWRKKNTPPILLRKIGPKSWGFGLNPRRGLIRKKKSPFMYTLARVCTLARLHARIRLRTHARPGSHAYTHTHRAFDSHFKIYLLFRTILNFIEYFFLCFASLTLRPSITLAHTLTHTLAYARKRFFFHICKFIFVNLTSIFSIFVWTNIESIKLFSLCNSLNFNNLRFFFIFF